MVTNAGVLGRAAEKQAAAKIKRATLHDEVVSRLRSMVLEGELPPGAKIPEQQICALFGISRTPLREALKVLASEGLIELRPNRGSAVAMVDPAETAALFEVKGALEELAGRLVCARISDEEIAELEALHARMVEQHRAENRAAYFESNQLFHRRLVELSRNPVLSATYDGFSTRILRVRYAANYNHDRWDESVAEHEEILAALRRRDGEDLARKLAEHNRLTGEAIMGHVGGGSDRR